MGRKGILCKASVSVLTFSLLLQIAAVASPGWMIVVIGNTEIYSSIFYILTCDTLDGVKCKAESFYDMHAANNDSLVSMMGLGTEVVNADTSYNGRVMVQVLFVSSIVCTLGAVLLHILRRDLYKKHACIISAIIALCGLSAGITVAVSCLFIVQNSNSASMLKAEGQMITHSYVGFPYSLTMMLVSILVHLAAMIILASQFYKPKEILDNNRQTNIAYIDLEKDNGPQSPPGVTRITSTNTAEEEVHIAPVKTTKRTIDARMDQDFLSEKL